MTIAINIIGHNNIYESAFLYYLYYTLPEFAKQHKSNRLVVIGNHNPFGDNLPDNISVVAIKEEVSKNPVKKLLYKNKVKKAFQRADSNTIISTIDNYVYAPKENTVIGVFNDVSNIPERKNNQLKNILQHCRSILCLSETISTNIANRYNIEPSKLKVVHPIVNIIPESLQDWKQHQNTKEKYTQGREFFLLIGTTTHIKELKTVLKAFSVFKKMQKSTMPLVIVEKGLNEHAVAEIIKKYKYKDDVICINEPDEATTLKINAAAYACIEHSSHNLFATLQCLALNVPVISLKSLSSEELFGDAVVYTPLNDIASLSEKIMILFKDEATRNEIIKENISQYKALSAKDSIISVWDSLLAVND